MTSEKPSVLKRLEGFRAQLDQNKEPVREKGREEKLSRGGRRVAARNARKTGVAPKPTGKGGKQMAKPVR